jgi:hypothetical protein
METDREREGKHDGKETEMEIRRENCFEPNPMNRIQNLKKKKRCISHLDYI